MATAATSIPPREAGAHARERADQLRRRLLAIVIGALAIAAVAFLAAGGHGPVLIGIEVVVLAAIPLAARLLGPRSERWARGARGERKVGAVLEALAPDWHVLHDVSLGRGNIDHVLVGPGGTFTVETKSHRGRISSSRLDEAMLRQAYAERKLLEKVSGLEVEALLVFSDAWLVGSPVARRRGVTVLPARMLADHLRRRPPRLDVDEVTEIAERLRLALEVDAALTR